MKATDTNIIVLDEEAMLALGQQLAHACHEGAIIFLSGELGAGKTTFSRGFLRGLGYTGAVKSPTYTLVEPYEIGQRKVYHFDFYRINNPQELEFMGIQDYLHADAICLIEWPEYGRALLPTADVSYDIAHQGSQREVKIVAHTALGETILQRLLHDK